MTTNSVEGPLSTLSPAKRALLERLMKQQASTQMQDLSVNQFGLWVTVMMQPEVPLYNVPWLCRLQGNLNVGALQRALGQVVERQQVLRSQYLIVDERPMMKIVPATDVELPIVDLRDLPQETREAQLMQLAEEEAKTTFDLTKGPVFRVKLIRLEEDVHVLLFHVHHIAIDLASMDVLMQDLAASYNACCTGEAPALTELPIQYADFAKWQRERLQGERLEKLTTYWRDQIGGRLPDPYDLPMDHARSATQTFGGRVLEVELPVACRDELLALGREERASLFMVMLALFKTLLFRYTNREDIVVGTVLANRDRSEVQGLVGYFLNTLPLCTYVDGGLTFRELVGRVRDVCLGAYAHQELPLDQLMDSMRSELQVNSAIPPFQVVFTMEEPAAQVDMHGLTVGAVEEVHAGTAKFDLTFSVRDKGDSFVLNVEYSTDLFEAETIQRMVGHFDRLLGGVAAHPDARLVDLPLLTEAEKQLMLVEWNQTEQEVPYDTVFPLLFEAQVERTPDRLAVVCKQQQLTYRELNRRANRLARRLQELGVGGDVVVGLLGERSSDLLIAILAVMKAGGAYLPMDPIYPAQRLLDMMELSKAPVLLVSSPLQDRVDEMYAEMAPDDRPHVVYLADLDEEFLDDSNLDMHITPLHLSYVIYTSGSTGKPKGVMIDHRGMINHLYAKIHDLEMHGEDVLAQTASQSFDISVWQYLAPLLLGGYTRVYGDEITHDPLLLLELTFNSDITILETTPSQLQVMLTAVPPIMPASGEFRLRWHMVTGEALDSEACRRWLSVYPGIPLVNAYGSTECSDDVTHKIVREVAEDAIGWLDVGLPVLNTQMYVLDPYLNPVPIGVPGEIYSAGIGVGRGYRDLPTRTAATFLPDPFTNIPGARMYKTGDLGRFTADGTIDFLGRLDHQVKIRGYRVELDEIETVINQHAQLRESVVLALGESSKKRLVAYVVPRPGADAPSVSEMREFIGERLPEYMIPSLFVFMDVLPLTPNGKVDRKALPQPDMSRPELDKPFTAPRNERERTLATIWQEVIGLEQVGIEDNFFELGGHSLLGIQVATRVREKFQVPLPLGSLFNKPTIAGLAEYIESLQTNEQMESPMPAIQPVPRNEQLPLSFAQHRLWFLDQLQPGSSLYNMYGTYRLHGALHVEALEGAINEIVRRHESLRTTFAVVDGEPVQVITTELHVPLQRVDLTQVPAEQREEKAQQLAEEESQRPFDLQIGPLVRVTLLELGVDSSLLILNMHHIVSDGWSMGVFFEELNPVYRALVEEQTLLQTEYPIQYADFAVWQRARAQEAAWEEQLAYWKGQLAGAPVLLDMPLDRPRPAVQQYRGAIHSFQLSKENSMSLEQLSKREGVTLNMTLLAVFNALLSRWTRQQDLVVGTVVANRSQPELENLIGFFVNSLPIRTDVSGDPTFTELLQRVKWACTGAFTNQDIPFEKIVDELKPERDLGYTPLIQAMCVLQNAAGAPELHGLRLEAVDFGSSTAKFDLMLTFEEGAEGLSGSFEYNTDLFDQMTIERLSGWLRTLLAAVVASPTAHLSEMSLLTEAERHDLLADWQANETYERCDRTVQQLFETQVEATPDAVAVCMEHDALTYRELNEQANQVAHLLRERGVEAGTLVGICMERSLEMIVALLGIVKSGGAYVPLDPSYPQDRLRHMMEDTSLSLLVTQEHLMDRLPMTGEETVLFVNGKLTLTEEGRRNPIDQSSAESVAYVMYTSGSTGRPKGVVVPQRGIVRLVQHGQFTAITASDVWLQGAATSFDAATLEVFAALLHGAKLALLPANAAGLDVWEQAIRQQGVTMMWLTAGLFNLFVDQRVEALRGIKHLFVGGDRLSVSHIAQAMDALPGTQLYNGYGPTENTTFTTLHKITPQDVQRVSIPIGRPLDRTTVYVLDERQQPVPLGMIGELYTGGDGLALGYLNRPELTAERFVPHPFCADPQAKLYRTGDLVRVLPDGVIEFIGRADSQVKVRGFRIELGEIEQTMLQHPAVRNGVAVVQEITAGDKRIVGYLVPHEQEQMLSVGDVRKFLGERLPDYMMPSAFVVVNELPLTPNGKVDRNALPLPDTFQTEREQPYVAPSNETEEAVAAIWRDVLRVDRVGKFDNFFDLGGNSFSAVRVIMEIENRLACSVPTATLFQNPSVEGLAESIETLQWAMSFDDLL